ncbi:MAG: sigma-70 family RNA polymerase sigma factor [Myxococcota bacterium]
MGDPSVSPHAADLALAAAAGAGDLNAAEHFMRRALPVVRRVARAIIADRTESEDALQLALIEVLGAAQTYRGTGALEPWIRKVASRVVLRHARKLRSSRLQDLEESGELGTTAMGTTMLDSLPRPLEEYLRVLPERQRTALMLRHALGHTIPEIAELTNSPEPTVVSRIKKARQQVRRLIQRDINLGANPVARTS